MFALLYTEINIICLLLLAVICFKLIVGPYQGNEQRLLVWLLLSEIVAIILDTLWSLMDFGFFPGAYGWHYAVNCCYNIATCLMCYFWFSYSETRQRSPLVATRRRRLLCALPMALLTVFTVISVKTGWLFYIDESNVFHAGPIYGVYPALCFGYILFTAIKALYKARRCRSYTRRRQLLALASFIVPSLLFGIAQEFFYDLPLLCVGVTLAVFYIYITLQEQAISIDPLTRLNNRNQLMQHLAARLARNNPDNRLFLLMMDVDRFKQVNDRFGHIQGDAALRQVAASLIEACGSSNYFIARYGGDEFVIIGEVQDEEEIAALCHSIDQALKIRNAQTKYQLSLSRGWACRQEQTSSPEDLLAAADRELYRSKAGRIS